MDIVEELKETIADIRDWNGDAMKAWDQIQKLIKDGNKTDFPRMIYENQISGYMETLIKAADEIERLRAALREILTHETDYEPYDCIEIARAALKEDAS